MEVNQYIFLTTTPLKTTLSCPSLMASSSCIRHNTILYFQLLAFQDYELTACLLCLPLNNHFEISYIWKPQQNAIRELADNFVFISILFL